MPTVAMEGQFRFAVNTTENAFEPPHEHLSAGHEDMRRIRLTVGTCLDSPPPGGFRDIPRAHSRYAGDIRRTWGSIHRRQTMAAVLDDGIGLTFADGCRGVVPFAELPEAGARPGVSTLELPNPCEVVPTTSPGEPVELPSDFARHCCDRSCRPAAAAMAQQGKRTLGERVRRLRKPAGLPHRELARSAGSGRVTLAAAGELLQQRTPSPGFAGCRGRALADPGARPGAGPAPCCLQKAPFRRFWAGRGEFLPPGLSGPSWAA